MLSRGASCSRLSGVRPCVMDVAWLCVLGQPPGSGVGWGRCLTTRPQLRVRVVKHLKEGCGGVAGMACGWFGVCCGVEPVEILIIEIIDRWCGVLLLMAGVLLLLLVFGGVFAVVGRIGSIGPRSPCGPVARRPDARGLSVPLQADLFSCSVESVASALARIRVPLNARAIDVFRLLCCSCVPLIAV